MCCASRKRAADSPAGFVSFFGIWKCSLPPQDFMSIIVLSGVNHAACFKLKSVCHAVLNFCIGQHVRSVL